jgi:hypothetical protein
MAVLIMGARGGLYIGRIGSLCPKRGGGSRASPSYVRGVLATAHDTESHQPPPRIIANGPRTHAGGKPLVSGSTGVADAVVVGEAVGLALGEADALALGEAVGLAEAEALEAGLAAALSPTPRSSIPLPLSSKPRSSLAEAEALLIALVEAEALEAGLATALSSTPRLFIPLSSKPLSSAPRTCIPLSSKPPSSPWAAATGANTDTANATDKTSNNHLRIVSPLFRLHIQGKDASPRFV